MSEPTSTEVVVDDRLWAVYMRGWAEGLRCGYADGYQAGAADEADLERQEWAALREQMQGFARDHGLLARRASYATPARTPEQIRALTDWSWRPGRLQDAAARTGTGA